MPDDTFAPATREDLRQALWPTACAARPRARGAVLAAGRLIEHLAPSAFVITKRPPVRTLLKCEGASPFCRPPERDAIFEQNRAPFATGVTMASGRRELFGRR